MDIQTSLLFYVNGKKIVETNTNPETTLLQYIRQNLRLTGSKNACNQGGCGACTVMLSKYDRAEQKIRHFTVNACITLLCSVHGYAVTTVEGVGSTRNGLHPIQKSLVNSHGIQCGFCTSGMVMTLYCLIRNKKNPTQEEVERVLEGNLCRCTGYRPIIDAMKPFYDCPMGDQCCKVKTNATNEEAVEQTLDSGYKPNDPTQDVIFPPELMNHNINEAIFKNKQWEWRKPITLRTVIDIKKAYPDSRIVVGGTALGYLIKTEKLRDGILIDCSDIPEMNVFDITSDGINVGASVSLARFEEKLQEVALNIEGEGKRRTVQTILNCIRWLAADQIRNMASIGGHIAHGDLLSDLNPLLLAIGCTIKVMNAEGSVRTISLDGDFFCGAYKTMLSGGDVILSVHIPFLNQNEHLEFFKQPQRRGFSYAIVNAALYLSLAESKKILSSRFCFGGVADRTYISCKSTEVMTGLVLDDACIATVVDALIADLMKINPSIKKYNLTLASSFVFKFFNTFLSQNENDKSAFKPLEYSPCESTQMFESVPDNQDTNDAVGRPIPLLSANSIVAGEAMFVDDLPRYENELFLCPVLSTKAHARIVSVDPSKALGMKDVVEYIDHRCIVGSNMWGCIENDEELFATEKVYTFGQLLGGVLAESREAATKAAKLVGVEYEELKPILTIEDAIEAKSFFENNSPTHEFGNVEEGFKNSQRVVEGTIRSGAQEHFYLEPLSVVAVPKNEQNEIELYVGHQTPSFQQTTIAKFLDVPANRIILRHRRAGGAFGGRESQNIRVCGPAAIAASRTGRPVRCVLERWQNIQNTGKRHPYLTKYKVGLTREGRILAIDFKIFSNAGNSLDVSSPVMESSIRVIDNCYKIPNMRIEECLCKTNTTSNTSFRGFGGPQAIVAIEAVIMEVALAVAKTPEEIREMNFLKEGDTTHLNMPLVSCNIQKCWSNCKQDSHYEDKRKEIEAFNKTSKWKKRGISLMPIKFPIGFSLIFLNQGSAMVNIYLDGSVSLTHGGCEIGQGLNTKMVQVASRALGIPIERIFTYDSSTATSANPMGTGASVTSDVIGAAVYDACTKLNERLKPFKEKNPDASWEELVNTTFCNRISLSVVGFGKPTMDETGKPFLYFTFGAACSVVEIDCLTGEHQLLSTIIVMDVGKSLNPGIDIGQIEGGFMQGYGMVTLEQIRMTPDGVPVCNGPINYKIPCIRNIPREFRVSLLKDCPNTKAVYSSKGIGEPPLLLAVSVFYAIKEAILSSRRESGLKDNFEFDCPATSERIRMACKDNITEKCNNENEKVLIEY